MSEQINSRLDRIETAITQLAQLLALMTGNPDLVNQTGAGVIDVDEPTGAVKLREVESLKDELRSANAGDHEIAEAIQFYPDFFLWQGVAASDEVRKEILINGGEREAFITAMLGVSRFFSPYDKYDVTIYDNENDVWRSEKVEDGRDIEIAVAFETIYSEPYTQEEVTQMALDGLNQRVEGIHQKREAAKMGAPEFSPRGSRG